jgi:hypothetical protein
MGLKIKLNKVEHDKLTDELKTLYIEDGDGFKLDADYEDVTGLKAKRDELLKEIAETKKAMKAFEGLDPEAAKAALDAKQTAEDDKLKAAGEFDVLKKKLEERHTKDLADATARESALLSNLKRERLQNYLVEKGVLPDRSAYAFVDIGDQIELASDESGFSLKLKGGIGDAKELETVVEGLKSKSPFLFSANGASGSGASGSDGKGSSTAKTVTRAQWDAASSEERVAWGPKIAVTD